MKATINKKLLGFFSGGVLIFILYAAGSFIIIRDLHRTLNEANALSAKAKITGDLRLEANRLLSPVNRYLITADIKERDNLDGILNEMSRLFAELKRFRGDKRWTDAASSVERDSIEAGDKALAILYTDRPVGNKKAHALAAELNLFSDRLVKEVNEFHNIAEEEIKKMSDEADKKTKRNFVYAMVMLTVSFLSVWVLYHYLKRFVTAPLRQLHEGAGIIAGGNLAYRLNIRTGDELEDLATELNAMSSSLENAKRELDRRIFELYTLYNLSKILATSFEMEELLGKIVNNISMGLKISGVVIMLIDERAGELYVASYTGFKGKELEKKKFKLGEGYYGWAAMTGEARMVTEEEKEAPLAPPLTPEDLLDPDVSSIVTVPFGAKGKTLGLLNAYKNRPETFSRKDKELLTAVGEQVALALENARLYKETKLLAITDGLTGLYNHRFFIERLESEVERAKRYRHPLSLIMIDIDSFKHYNDAHGHQQGDLLLRLLSDLLKRSLRNSDFAARYGGEEFSVILAETDKENAAMMAERIRKAIEEYPFPHEETQPGGNITISSGVATLGTADDADALIKKADDVLYTAKQTGRNKVISA